MEKMYEKTSMNTEGKATVMSVSSEEEKEEERIGRDRQASAWYARNEHEKELQRKADAIAAEAPK